MEDKLTISDLRAVLATLTEVTKPYQLGIQLKIESSELDTIEKNHPQDIDRQKTEVVKYWLRNSPDPSWTTLASALERMGGHARLAIELRSKDRQIQIISANVPVGVKGDEKGSRDEQMSGKPVLPSTQSDGPQIVPDVPLKPLEPLAVPLGEEKTQSAETKLYVHRYILLLGKMGHGKSTLGNRMLDLGGSFKINDQQCPQTTKGSAILKSRSRREDYQVDIYDHNGLFDGASSIDTLSSDLPVALHLVVFVLKHGRSFKESEVKVLKSIVSKWKISEISALVLTHCENLSEEERKEMIEQFKKDHPSVAELMGKGILAVGFPDSSYVENDRELIEMIEDDKANLRQLIYSCDDKVYIPKPSPSNLYCSIL